MAKNTKSAQGNIRGHNLQISRNVTRTPQKKTWRVVLMRNRGEFLGYVDAPDASSAEAAAVREFNLSVWHSRRLLIQERP